MQEEKGCDTQDSVIEEKTDNSLECVKNSIDQKGHDSTISAEQFNNFKVQLKWAVAPMDL